MLGQKMYYFIPNLHSDEMVVKSDFVIATEFDNVDNTFKVRFLNGDAVQMWATGLHEELLKEPFNQFQEYRKVYHECREAVRPHEERLRAKYEELFGDFMDIELGQTIKDRHNPEKVLAKEESDAAEADVQ
jgi:hypothetical protein